jgi:hypothetical protein
MTLCPKHLLPLEQTCMCCHRIGWPVCERTIFRRFRFFCSHCSSPKEMSRWIGPEPNSSAVRPLICFEKQLLAALANRAVEWSWIGQATPGEFQRLLNDLLWALTSYGYGSKPIHRLQTSSLSTLFTLRSKSGDQTLALCLTSWTGNACSHPPYLSSEGLASVRFCMGPPPDVST